MYSWKKQSKKGQEGGRALREKVGEIKEEEKSLYPVHSSEDSLPAPGQKLCKAQRI